MVYVLDEKRLVNVAKFKASSNQYDHVYLIKSSDYGIWLSLIGSSLIYLYDHINYEFKFIFNPKLNQIEHSMMEEEYNFNSSRITSLLVLKESLWIGTADGYLSIYTIHRKEVNRIDTRSDKSQENKPKMSKNRTKALKDIGFENLTNFRIRTPLNYKLKRSISNQFINKKIVIKENLLKYYLATTSSSTINEDWFTDLETFRVNAKFFKSSLNNIDDLKKSNKPESHLTDLDNGKINSLSLVKKKLHEIANDLNSLKTEDFNLKNRKNEFHNINESDHLKKKNNSTYLSPGLNNFSSQNRIKTNILKSQPFLKCGQKNSMQLKDTIEYKLKNYGDEDKISSGLNENTSTSAFNLENRHFEINLELECKARINDKPIRSLINTKYFTHLLIIVKVRRDPQGY